MRCTCLPDAGPRAGEGLAVCLAFLLAWLLSPHSPPLSQRPIVQAGGSPRSCIEFWEQTPGATPASACPPAPLARRPLTRPADRCCTDWPGTCHLPPGSSRYSLARAACHGSLNLCETHRSERTRFCLMRWELAR